MPIQPVLEARPSQVNILAIDQGTSATKAILVGPGGEPLGASVVPVAVRTIEPDGVETDPDQLFASVIEAGAQALAAARAPVGAVALANQGETVLAWDRRTGRPLSPAIVWQDRRSAPICERIAANAGLADRLARITGLPLDPYFAAPKMTWLRENLGFGNGKVGGDGFGARGGDNDVVVTTTDAWLLARLSGLASYSTDASTASRTMLLDLESTRWSDEACQAFGVDPGQLPDVADCAGPIAETDAFTSRAAPVPIAGLAVDQQAALIAEGCFDVGQAKCTYGTGAFLLATTGRAAVRSAAGLSSSVAWRLAGVPDYCLDGQVYTAGAAVAWLDEVGLLASVAELDVVAGSVTDSGGVTFVPALAGLGAPHWHPAARGAFLGLGLGTSRAHLIRAFIEGLAGVVTLLARAVATDIGQPLTVLRADGGLSRSRLLMQTQADLLQAPVQVCHTPDATALGVAALARLGLGQAADLRTSVGPVRIQSVIEPSISADEAAERLAELEFAITTTLAMAR
jgi:glycerol kinase